MAQGVKAGRELATNPQAVRARMRSRHRKVVRDEDELIEHAKLLPHYKPVEEWDMEELARGRPRGKDGSFHGPKPVWIGPIVRQEAKRRLNELAGELLEAEVGNAIKVMAQLMMDDSTDEWGAYRVDARTRVDAAKFIIEQVRGKAKQRIDVDTGPGIRDLLAKIMVNPDGKPDYNPRVINEDGEDVE